MKYQAVIQVLIVCVSMAAVMPVMGAGPLEVAGVNVVPHVLAPTMQYRVAPDSSLGARVQLFVRNTGAPELRLGAADEVRVRGQLPAELLAQGKWAWHDFPSAWPEDALVLPLGAMTVWNFNGNQADWGVGTAAPLSVATAADGVVADQAVGLEAPQIWMTSVTFLSSSDSVYPDTMVIHVQNGSKKEVKLQSTCLWLPANNGSWRVLMPGQEQMDFTSWPADGVIPPGERGILRVETGRLPLTYGAVEVRVISGQGEPYSIWSHLRIKREVFDISGGWVNNAKEGVHSLSFEPFLKALVRLYVNTGHIADGIPGYTDQTGPDGLYTRFPLKFFSALTPFEQYDIDAMLPRIHAVEFLGEPQYGGGRPVPPMEVWQALAPYQRTRLATSVTHSEERIWREYAGLSDYPHYDAYRVSAPSPDAWRKYDRWDGVKIGWGSPLETIGEMSRSLRDLNRPMPTAYWSQGPHQGWDVYDRRERTSPTADELRLQAYHALSSRITSLYWFNLSVASLVKFRDTLEPMTQIGREIRMLEEFYLEGDAYKYEQAGKGKKLDWDLASIVAPQGTLLFALDLDYTPDSEERVFQFGPPRKAKFSFDLPAWLRDSVDVFRVDAGGVYSVKFKQTRRGVAIEDTAHKVAIYVATQDGGMREAIEARRQQLLAGEAALQFDPAHNDGDFAVLEAFSRERDAD